MSTGKHRLVSTTVVIRMQGPDVRLGSTARLKGALHAQAEPLTEQIGVKSIKSRQHADGIGDELVIEVDAHFTEQALAGQMNEFMLQSPAS